MGTLHEMYVYLRHLTKFFLEWEMFRTKDAQKNRKNTFYVEHIFNENHAVYEIMRKNMAGPDRPQMEI